MAENTHVSSVGKAEAGDSRPVPDPTILTTEALTREINGVREWVDREFARMEAYRIEQKADSGREISAALAAVKEANAKTEAAFAAENAGLRRSQEEQKDRIGRLENRVTSVEQQKVGANENRSGLYAAIGVSVTVVLAALTILGFFLANVSKP